MNLIQSLVSALIIFPILIYMFVWWGAKAIGIRKAKRTGLAADVTTVVLFFAVASVYNLLGIPNPITNLLLFLLFIAIILIVILWRKKQDVGPRIIFRLLWRIYFIVLSLFYFIGWIIGLTRSIMSYLGG